METEKQKLEDRIYNLIDKIKNSPLSEKKDWSYKLAEVSSEYKSLTGDYFKISDSAMGNFD